MVLRNAQCSRPARNTGRRRVGSGSRLLTVPLGLAGVLAALTGTAVGLAVLGLAGVGRLLGPALLWGLLLGLLLTATLLWGLLLAALLRSLLLGLLLTTALLWGLLLGLLLTTALLRGLLLTTTGRIVGGLEPGVLLGPPGGCAVRVARRAVAAHRGAELAQVSDNGLSLGLLLTELVEQEVRPQVSQCARPVRFETQLLLGQLHDLRIGDGDAVGLADLLDDGGLDEGARDIDPRRGLTLLPSLLAGLGSMSLATTSMSFSVTTMEWLAPSRPVNVMSAAWPGRSEQPASAPTVRRSATPAARTRVRAGRLRVTVCSWRGRRRRATWCHNVSGP
ncbi:hypothetical protein [Actinomyces naeslundii]|uniref:hypothetical protein n=1 Tax=Actinomyces naeslundii TaxID=1655 RepID=UPI0015C54D93|nr:hypothetical protein [Actinomyces naeslundii]